MEIQLEPSQPRVPLLETVDPLPLEPHTDWFDAYSDTLTGEAAEAILFEIWRLTRNLRFLQIEYQTRGKDFPAIQLDSLCLQYLNGDTLDATATAREFIETVRTDYADLLVADAEAFIGDVTAAQQLEPLC